VSTDLIGESASAVVDTRWLTVEDGRYLKATVGYDNEWGYCCRVLDLIDRIEKTSADGVQKARSVVRQG
jgi:glyceraldehyde 3-phosphate dehydrogenase